uniref:Uncharacterized protein n=1 Tax=Heterorhabditis bacteriophora TaxID=37862 RepID=A0A1I7XGJ1_HETBA
MKSATLYLANSIADLIVTLDEVNGDYEEFLNAVTLEISRKSEAYGEYRISVYIFRYLYTADGKSFEDLLKCDQNITVSNDIRHHPTIENSFTLEKMEERSQIHFTPTTRRPTTKKYIFYCIF